MSDQPNQLPVLPQITIGTPCPMNWDEMQGSESKRFCLHCEKHVHTFSQMDADSISKLLNSGERVCARIQRRADGSIVTNSAGETRRSWLGRLGAVAAGVLGLLTLGGCSELASGKKSGSNSKSGPEIDPEPYMGIVAPEPPAPPETTDPEAFMGDVAIAPEEPGRVVTPNQKQLPE